MQVVNAITYLRDFNTGGHKPVLILADDRKKYVVKPIRSAGFDYQIYNELIGHHFLSLWDIPTPEIALVNVPSEVLHTSENARQYKKVAYQYPFFGSVYQENPIELTDYLSFHKKVDFRRLKNPDKFIRLGLFDIWIENDDRKPSNYNILLLPDKKKLAFSAIDHALILNSLNYTALKPAFGVANSLNDNILYSRLTRRIVRDIKPNRDWIQKEQELFYICVQKCEAAFDKILSNLQPHFQLPAGDRDQLAAFLFSKERNKQVFRDFCARISGIINKK